MRATGIYFTGKETLELREVDVAEPGPGQVLLQTTRTLISTGTECIAFQRNFAAGSHWDRWVQYPFAAGYSAAGRVLAVGAGVTHVKPGDRVAGLGTHQSLSLIPAAAATAVPDGVSDEEATWATLAYITQHGFRKPAVKLGETVAVIGVGLLGQLAVQYTRVAGARHVIAIDPAAPRLAMAAAATHHLAMGVDAALQEVERITAGRLADVVFDMTGNHRVFADATRLLRRFGRLTLIGDSGTPAEQHLSSEVIRRDLSIFAAHAGNAPDEATDEAPWSKRAMVELFFALLLDGRMRVKDLVTHRFRPAQATEAYALLTRSRERAMGVVFEFD